MCDFFGAILRLKSSLASVAPADLAINEDLMSLLGNLTYDAPASYSDRV